VGEDLVNATAGHHVTTGKQRYLTSAHAAHYAG
jgi:hypothetical protein